MCYAKGIEILCLVNGKETYIKIENLKKDMTVKIYNPNKNEYKKVFGVSKSIIYPSLTQNLAKMYLLKKNKLGENNPHKDVYVTGGHSYLVNEIKDDNVMRFMINCNPTFGAAIHDKYKLLVSMSNEWEPVNSTDPFTIFHFALECEQEFGQYGVYANGTLNETMCLFFFKKRKVTY
jgi:hypothetical protein